MAPEAYGSAVICCRDANMLFDVLFLGTWKDKDRILIGPSSPDGLKMQQWVMCISWEQGHNFPIRTMLEITGHFREEQPQPIPARCPSRMGHCTLPASPQTPLPVHACFSKLLPHLLCGMSYTIQEKCPMWIMKIIIMYSASICHILS